MKKIIFQFAILFLAFNAFSQDAKFSVKVSKTTVSTQTKFKVEYILENAKDDNFKAPNFEDFDIVGGPSISSQMYIFNKDVSQSLSYTYLLRAKKTGEFVLPTASVNVKGATLKTEEVKIKVLATSDSEESDEDATMEEKQKSDDFFSNDFMSQFFRQQMPQPKKEQPKKKAKTYSL
jgi:hypothetical protein